MCVLLRLCIPIAQDTKDSTLMELIAQSEDRPMQLLVYNVKSQTTRGTFRTSCTTCHV